MEELSRERETSSQLRIESDQLRKQINNLDARIFELEGQIDRLKRSLSESDSKIQIANNDIEYQKKEQDKLVDSYELKIRNLQDQASDLRTQMFNLEAGKNSEIQ